MEFNALGIKPLRDQVLLQLEPPKEKTQGGIFIPGSSQSQDVLRVAVVVAVGPGKVLDGINSATGLPVITPPEVQAGQTVLIPGSISGMEFKLGENRFALVAEQYLLATVAPVS